jgi:hypothetical protein
LISIPERYQSHVCYEKVSSVPCIRVGAGHAGAATGRVTWALEDRYIREHWDEIYALCKLNSLPFNATGEVIENHGIWRVYQFTWQIDAILFWARFEGRWLRGTEFHYPERAREPALAKAARELAEIQSAQSAVIAGTQRDEQTPSLSFLITSSATADSAKGRR